MYEDTEHNKEKKSKTESH